MCIRDSYYYYPGWHEPGSTLEIIINKDAYESLPKDLKAIIKYAAKSANQEMLDEYTARNNKALTELIDKHDVDLRKLPDSVLRELKKITDDVMRHLNDPEVDNVLGQIKNLME